MQQDEFLKQQFITIREEIKAIKARLFWTVVLGLFGVPVVTFVAQSAEKTVSLLIPYLVLVIIILFLAEQSALMRAGRYIRQVIEPKVGSSAGWEAWLESRSELRLMDRHFVACFIIVFFVYYFMSIGFVMLRLWSELQDTSYKLSWIIGVMVTYAIGAIWALTTLLHHWRFATRTSDDGS